jgi:hypothetical protein
MTYQGFAAFFSRAKEPSEDIKGGIFLMNMKGLRLDKTRKMFISSVTKPAFCKIQNFCNAAVNSFFSKIINNLSQ